MGQFVGFSPSETRNAFEGKSAVVSHDRALMTRRRTLVEQFAMAAMAKDEEGKAEARAAIAKFNDKNPERRIQPAQLAQSVRNRGKRRDALDVGRFASEQGAQPLSLDQNAAPQQRTEMLLNSKTQK